MMHAHVEMNGLCGFNDDVWSKSIHKPIHFLFHAQLKVIKEAVHTSSTHTGVRLEVARKVSQEEGEGGSGEEQRSRGDRKAGGRR